MMIQQSLLPQARRIRMSASLSPEARRRLRWMEFYEAHGRNARLTCRHFDISSATFYSWWRRYIASVPTRPWTTSPRMSTSRNASLKERGKVFRIYWTSTLA
jgi:transposase-like protein